MSQRSIRVNELIKREISHLLRLKWQQEAVAITISDVSITPDLRTGHVYYSVVGDAAAQQQAARLFQKKSKEIHLHLGRTIRLKYMPKLKFHYDDSMERGANIIQQLDELEQNTPDPHDQDND